MGAEATSMLLSAGSSILLILAMMSVLAWRESHWPHRAVATWRRRVPHGAARASRWVRPVSLGALLMAVLLAGSAGAETARGCGAFRVEWNLGVLSPTDGKLEGFVYNDSPCAVSDVRLHVVAVDSQGRPVGEGRGWVHGDIQAGGRGYFVLPVPDGPRADSYRVNVVEFDRISTVPQAP